MLKKIRIITGMLNYLGINAGDEIEVLVNSDDTMAVTFGKTEATKNNYSAIFGNDFTIMHKAKTEVPPIQNSVEYNLPFGRPNLRELIGQDIKLIELK